MNKFHSFIIILLLMQACASSKKLKQAGPDPDNIFRQYAQESYALNPLSATLNNVNDYNDQLAFNLGDNYVSRSLQLNNRYLDTLALINYGSLSESARLSVDILRYQLQMLNEGLANKYSYYRPVDQFVGSFPQRFALLASGDGGIPFKSENDFRNFINRMKLFREWIDQAITAMDAGIRSNNTNPKASMVKVPEQLKPFFELSAEKNLFYKPLLSLPAGLDSVSKQALRADYTNAIENYIRPSYKKLHDYLLNTYIPAARSSSGLIANNNGRNEYKYWLKNYTTVDINADEIFELGLREVARIRKEMDSVKQVTGFNGSLKDFFAFIKTDPKFFPFKTVEEVLNRYRSYEAQMEPQLKKLFNLRPRAKFEVRATEKFREAASNAQYIPPARAGVPGIFYETVRDPRQFNYFEMESQFMHEAIPGHHYQLAIQKEADIPEFRKKLILSAFAEGWALYAESLGIQLGMYTDPYQYMGRLHNEMERALRLVIDAGLHHKGWTREQAIAYTLENQPVTELVAEQKVERYMVLPGQATSYKIGELKILELRNRAMKALGSKFDIREFHDQVLKNGCIPLSLLERQIDNWIRSKQ